MPPTRTESQNQARHFANTVFVIGAGIIMFSATLIQPHTLSWLGGVAGEHFPFIAGTVLIAWLALQRPQLALFALKRQCAKHGHLPNPQTGTCERCLERVGGDDPTGSRSAAGPGDS